MPATPPSELLKPCLTCLGMSAGDALEVALWDSISQNISPSGETFYRISDLLDVRISDVGDNRIYV